MTRSIWKTLALAATLTLAACGDTDDDSAGDDTGVAATGACELAAENDACPECYDGEVTCEFGDFSATEGSCGDCQARSALYRDLCDAGVEDSAADIEAGTTCSDPVQ